MPFSIKKVVESMNSGNVNEMNSPGKQRSRMKSVTTSDIKKSVVIQEL